MNVIAPDDRKAWTVAGAVALAGHVGLAALVLAWSREPAPVAPEPVVLIELPALPVAEVPAPAALPEAQSQPQEPAPQTPTTPIDVPPARMAVPSSAVTLPPPAPVPPPRAAMPAAVAPSAPPSVPAAAAASPATAADPRAKKQEADYFALISAHLNRRKTYPAEAKQARQQGVVTVRFTVDRNGSVSGASIKRSSGHEILDRATLDLLQRVAPLPRMPSTMQRDSVSLSLPIDYSLRTN